MSTPSTAAPAATTPPGEPELTGHVYDGIQEFDNPTPGWWNAIFVLTIVFSFCYVLYWHVSFMRSTIQDSWAADQRAEYTRIFGEVGELKADEATILAQMDHPEFMQVAQALFVGNCAACHRKDGTGDVGVNLCDDYYKNVTKVEDIHRVISDGANQGAMPPWKSRFSKNEIVVLSAYVASLRGTTSGGKAPEGQQIPPWPKTPAAK